MSVLSFSVYWFQHSVTIDVFVGLSICPEAKQSCTEIQSRALASSWFSLFAWTEYISLGSISSLLLADCTHNSASYHTEIYRLRGLVQDGELAVAVVGGVHLQQRVDTVNRCVQSIMHLSEVQ